MNTITANTEWVLNTSCDLCSVVSLSLICADLTFSVWNPTALTLSILHSHLVQEGVPNVMWTQNCKITHTLTGEINMLYSFWRLPPPPQEQIFDLAASETSKLNEWHPQGTRNVSQCICNSLLCNSSLLPSHICSIIAAFSPAILERNIYTPVEISTPFQAVLLQW